MASVLKVDDLRGNTAAGNITITSEGGAVTQSLQQGLLKYWNNWDGTGTIASRDSLNASALVDGGAGLYTNKITNPFRAAEQAITGESGNYCYTTQSTSYSVTTTQFYTYVVRYNTTTYTDASGVFSTASGDLA